MKPTIRCSKDEQRMFIKKTCPNKFNDVWPCLLTCQHDMNDVSCRECWEKYVNWEINDAR